MLVTVLFRNVSLDLHKKIKAESAISEVPMYKLYNCAMEEFPVKIKKSDLPVYFTFEPIDHYKDTRVEKIDSEIYKEFKIICIRKDISISQGINLALEDWLERQQNDSSGLELRT